MTTTTMTTTTMTTTPVHTTTTTASTTTMMADTGGNTTVFIKLLVDGGFDLSLCAPDIVNGTLQEVTDCLSLVAASWLSSMAGNLDMFFLVLNGIIVYLMQGGFALLECGAVRSKNATNILIKNVLDSLIGAISYWLVGYALAFGEGNVFCGNIYWALSSSPGTDLAMWFFQYVFAATAATIVSGAVAERCEFFAYITYSIVITGFVYPVVTHWTWSEYGWLNQGFDYEYNNQTLTKGYQDFAGSGIVHVLGGTAALIGAIFLGPRIGRFTESGDPQEIKGHSVPLAATGGFLLFFGFFAFNGGSELGISGPGAGVNVARAVSNTIISASMAGLTCLIVNYIKSHCMAHTKATLSLLTTINGALAGMVAICAGCNVYYPWAACVVGTVAGFTYIFWSFLILKLKIDDPLDAVAVHGGAGIWGVLAVPILQMNSGLVFTWDTPAAMGLAINLLGVVAIIAWTAVVCCIMFFVLAFFGLLRVDPEVEVKGLDVPKHGEAAYPTTAYGDGWQAYMMRRKSSVGKVLRRLSVTSSQKPSDNRRGSVPEVIVEEDNPKTHITMGQDNTGYDSPPRRRKGNSSEKFVVIDDNENVNAPGSGPGAENGEVTVSAPIRSSRL